MAEPTPKQPHPAKLQPNRLSDHQAALPESVAARNTVGAELAFLKGLV